MNDEGLADAAAANPFRLPRLHPGIGSPRNHQKVRPSRPPILGDLLRRLQGSQTRARPGYTRGRHAARDPVPDAVTVLTPQLIDEGRFGIEPGAPVVTRSYQLKYWFAATICAAT